MKPFILLILFLNSIAVQAQENYQASGKISGITDGPIFLIKNDGTTLDTLATTTLHNGVFLFKGNTNLPISAYISTADGSLTIPFILESTPTVMNVNAKGALIRGGKQQQLFTLYNRIGQTYVSKQAEIQVRAGQRGADITVLQAEIDRIYRESQQQTMEVIKANPDSYATAYIIAQGIFTDTEEGLQKKYALLGDNAKASVPGKQIAAALDQYIKLAPGQDAPNFTTRRPNGDALTLYDLPAKIKLVVFWASWDAASRQANPDLISLYQQFRPQGLEIISISLDTNRFEWTHAIEQDGLIWANGSDLRGRESEVAKLYMVRKALPCTVLIGPDNKIVSKGLLSNELRATISDLVKEMKRKK